ncbi:MAG TPA: BON domain-containing protein [Egibacteraceae bacterium]|nr:BON domain-containing protein [Egibacteraceae bacterium]
MSEQPLDPYATEHLRDALAHDPRVGTLDIHVRAVGDVLVVTGNVTSAEQRDAVDEVLGELVTDTDIRNDVTVAELSEPDGQEAVS